MASTYDLFERAERVELLSARIYGALATRFAGDPRARALFARLETDEEQHARRVRLLAAHYRNDTRLAVGGDGRELDRCVDEAGRALAEVEGGLWPADLGEVRLRLAALEERLASAHAELLAVGATPALRDFFFSLAEQDRAHADLLDGLAPRGAVGEPGESERTVAPAGLPRRR